MNNIIAFTFKKEKEAKKFLDLSKKTLADEKFTEHYDTYIDAVPSWRRFKSFLYLIATIAII